MSDPSSRSPRSPDAPADAPRRAKRSATVSLVLVAGAGVAALVFGHLDPAQQEEEALVYGTPGDCIAQGLRTAEVCLREYDVARAAYGATAPRYESAQDCEGHHGQGGCVAGATVTADATGSHLPLMAGYMIGRSDEQALPTQPLYAHAPREENGHSGGGYCTGGGGRVVSSNGSSHVIVPTRVARAVSTTPRMIARGGFGGTGRATAFSGSFSGWSGG